MQTPGPYPALSPAVHTAHNWAQDPGTSVDQENHTHSKQASESLLYLKPQDARGRGQEIVFYHLLTNTEIQAVLRSKRSKGTPATEKRRPPSEALLLLGHTAGAPREQALLPESVPHSVPPPGPFSRFSDTFGNFFDIFRNYSCDLK